MTFKPLNDGLELTGNDIIENHTLKTLNICNEKDCLCEFCKANTIIKINTDIWLRIDEIIEYSDLFADIVSYTIIKTILLKKIKTKYVEMIKHQKDDLKRFKKRKYLYEKIFLDTRFLFSYEDIKNLQKAIKDEYITNYKKIKYLQKYKKRYVIEELNCKN